MLPYTSDAGGSTNSINCIYNVQKIFITRHVFGSCVLINLPATLEYRYVLIPGLISGGRLSSGPAAGYTETQLRSMSYSSLMRLLKIPE